MGEQGHNQGRAERGGPGAQLGDGNGMVAQGRG